MLSLFILSRQINVTVGEFDIIGSSTLAGLDRETFQIFVAILAPLISLNLGYGQFSRALAGSFGTARFLRGNGTSATVPPGAAPGSGGIPLQ